MKVIKKTGQIYWGSMSATFQYGSKTRYLEKEHIYFENRLMVSGQVIHAWDLVCSYQAMRLQPALPLLKRGKNYCLTAYMDLFPKDSVFLKVCFFDRYDKEVGSRISRTRELFFTYPKEAYKYQIQLLSAGIESMDFYYLTLEEQEVAHVT